MGNPVFAVIAQSASFCLLWQLVGSLKFALVMWLGMRIFAMVGQYDSKLLDPHSRIWIPAV